MKTGLSFEEFFPSRLAASDDGRNIKYSPSFLLGLGATCRKLSNKLGFVIGRNSVNALHLR